MNRESFLDMFKELAKSYGAKKVFEPDDYYGMVKYVPTAKLDDLRKRIIEECEYLPKPSELKKIAYEFNTRTTPYEAEDPCISCGLPAQEGSYYCKKCAELHEEYIEKVHKSFIANGYPVDQVNIHKHSELDERLKQLIERYG